MLSKSKFSFLAALLMVAGLSTAQADSMGTLGFADIGAPTVSPGTSINGATIYNIGNLVTTAANSGIFDNIPTQVLGPVSFDVTNGSSLTFGNSVLGNFQSSSITQISNSAGQVSYYIVGNFTGGSFPGATTPNPAPASFTNSFTQTPAGTGSISDSATLSVPPSPTVPEPASIVLVGLGLASVGVVARRKKTATV